MDRPIILTAHQPVYMPWLGLFHKIALADVFCYFDIVQYQRKDFNNRNKINTANGPIWLSVPVKSSGRFESIISDIKIENQEWGAKHLKSIELNYKKTKFFNKYIDLLSHILLGTYDRLVDLNYDYLIFGLSSLGIKTKVVKASGYKFQGEKSNLVLDMCVQLNSSVYIFGEKGHDYADRESFNRKRIYPYFQSYNHPVYPQRNKNFVPFMSFLDLLFNHGEDSLQIIMSENISREDIIQNYRNFSELNLDE